MAVPHRVVSLDGISSASLVDHIDKEAMAEVGEWLLRRIQNDTSGVIRWNTVFAEPRRATPTEVSE